MFCPLKKYHYFDSTTFIFSTSHVIPHIRALVPCPGLTSEVCVVAGISVPLTPTEILNSYFCMPTEILTEYYPKASKT